MPTESTQSDNLKRILRNPVFLSAFTIPASDKPSEVHLTFDDYVDRVTDEILKLIEKAEQKAKIELMGEIFAEVSPSDDFYTVPAFWVKHKYSELREEVSE